MMFRRFCRETSAIGPRPKGAACRQSRRRKIVDAEENLGLNWGVRREKIQKKAGEA